MKPWTAKTREQFRLPAQFLEEVMEGRPLAQVMHDDLVTLNSCFEKLHGPTFRKSARQREMTILEIVGEYAAKVAEGEKAAEQAAARSSSNILDVLRNYTPYSTASDSPSRGRTV